ncbi:MAG: gamma-glutamyl-gamma-aminobutyrate hydrolase family protein [Alphaproteobacteria bacterium]|nr:gamma-glutamyl-gamma-aminobutyrate hydrolase family protein [Alphaproteobacteria bacterium]
MFPLPVIGIPCCTRSVQEVYNLKFHMSPNDCSTAIIRMAKCFPVLLPAIGDTLDKDPMLPEDIVEGLDGILLPGSPSNVNPTYYDEKPYSESVLYDSLRDSTTFPLIRAAIKQNVPLLGICRGFQELNVALGGTLYQNVEAQHPGSFKHYDYNATIEGSPFIHRHDVRLTEVGILYRIAKKAGARQKIEDAKNGRVYSDFTGDVSVSSIHHQGIKEVAEGLFVEARAKDGLVEAVSVGYSKTFAVGVQWHPERYWRNDTFSRQLFKEFGDAARKRHRARTFRRVGDVSGIINEGGVVRGRGKPIV